MEGKLNGEALKKVLVLLPIGWHRALVRRFIFSFFFLFCFRGSFDSRPWGSLKLKAPQGPWFKAFEGVVGPRPREGLLPLA